MMPPISHTTKGCSSELTVRPIGTDETREWFLYKHYAKRLPNTVYAFGLYDGARLVGVCSFGVPPSPSLIIGSMGEEYKDRFLELNRLCVEEGLPPNSLSFFVSRCLRMLPAPMVVVSYADTAMGHHGYIYQATNFLYTGLTKPHKEYSLEGSDNKHSRHLLDSLGGINEAKRKGVALTEGQRSLKHRYFFFCGTKKQRSKMLADLKYAVLPYPKGNNARYDASYQTHNQGILF